MRYSEALNIEELRAIARRRVPKIAWDFLDGGAEDNLTLDNNRDVFRRIRFRPHTMIDVSKRSAQTEIFGKTFKAPFGIAPTGAAGLYGFKADSAMARAARDAGLPFVLSTASFEPLEDVAKAAAGGTLWFQLYMAKSRPPVEKLVTRALEAGFEALVLTSDVAQNGNREYNRRNGFTTPLKLNLRNLIDGALHPRWSLDVFLRTLLDSGVPRYRNVSHDGNARITDRPAEFQERREEVNWEFPVTARDVVLMGRYRAIGWLRWPGDNDRERAEEREAERERELVSASLGAGLAELAGRAERVAAGDLHDLAVVRRRAAAGAAAVAPLLALELLLQARQLLAGAPGLAGFVVPKQDSVGDVAFVDRLIASIETRKGLPLGGTPIIVMIESAAGVLSAREIIGGAARIESAVYAGGEDGDMNVSLGATWSSEGPEMMFVRQMTFVAARANNIQYPLDGVFSNVRDPEAFRRDTLLSKRLGFRGRTVIHPTQIDIANEIYSPTAAEIDYAKRVIAAYEEAVARGIGSTTVDGKLVDVAMAKTAQNILDLVATIKAQNG